MKTSNLMLPALVLALFGAAAIGCGSSDSGGASGGGGAATGGTGGATGGTGGATGGTGGATGGAGGATGGTGGATGGTGGATGGTGGATGGTGGATGGTGGATGGTGGATGGTGGGTGGATGCSETIEITLGDTALLGADGTMTAFGSVPSPALGDATLTDEVQLQFYADDTGTIDLATAPNDNFSTCMQCALALEDRDPNDGTPVREYFQAGGTVEIDASTPPLTSTVIKATLTDVTLMEATIDWSGDYTSTFVPNGKCLHIASASYDIGCGNGKIDGTEQCDGTELANTTCQSIGFTAGDLACSASCAFDTSACTGWTCAATSLGAFAGTDITQHGDTCTGSSAYNAEGNGTSCTDYDTLGKELVYTLEVPASSSAQVIVAGAYDSAVWVTSACDDLGGAACIVGNDAMSGNDQVTIENATAAAVTYYVIVDGYGAGNCGEFDLTIRTPVVPPAAWTCDAAFYSAMDGCDCACGAWDPDCDIAGATVYRCPDDGNTYTCEKPDGTCVAQ